MMREQVVYRGPLVSLMRYDHPAGRTHRDPSGETSTHHSVSFIERGGFDVLHRGRWLRMAPETVFVTHPGFAYRCAHTHDTPDDVCLSVHYDPALVEDLQTTIGRRWMRRVPAAALTNRLAYLRHRLAAVARSGDAAMAATTLAGDLLAALGDDGGAGEGGARLLSAGHIARYARRIEAARALLGETPQEPHTLEGIARQAGMSPFHFSRLFRQMIGVPPHRYLKEVRLRRAAGLLAAGAGVTETCHAAGFNNLGHFIRTFRRAYGVPPSRYRG